MIYVLVAECHAMRSFANSNWGILCKNPNAWCLTLVQELSIRMMLNELTRTTPR
jgi:hypothetical protein